MGYYSRTEFVSAVQAQKDIVVTDWTGKMHIHAGDYLVAHTAGLLVYTEAEFLAEFHEAPSGDPRWEDYLTKALETGHA